MISTTEPAVALAQDDAKPADSPTRVPDTTSQPNPPSSPDRQSATGAGADAKDRRAYEVARQRVKHAQEWCKARERKAAAKRGWLAGCGVNDNNGRRARGAQEPIILEAERVKGVGVLDDALEEHLPSSGQDCGVQSPDRVDTREVAHTVRLEDLVRVAKVRSDKVGDFELIPHVRTVLALDDSEFVSEAESDNHKMVPDFDYEGWEHVDSCSGSGSGTSSSDEDEPRKAPSYAQVVSSAKH